MWFANTLSQSVVYFFLTKKNIENKMYFIKLTFISSPSSYLPRSPINNHLKVMVYPSIVYFNMSKLCFEYLVKYF